METYTLPEHPDSRIEYDHLQETCNLIRHETELMEKETGAKAGEDGDVIVREDPDLDDETSLNLFRMKMDRLRQLTHSAKQAYFARLDFTPDHGEPETLYLGRWGVLRDDFSAAVVDWRSPVANLYYSGQLGRVDYEAPDGRVNGELSLKRMLGVEGNRLRSIFDTDIINRDEYLQGVLGSVSSDRLKEIVTTIQGEQNQVIRHPLQSDLIVQGAAGSGKTTIALHRIAYLLYVYRDLLRPEKMMILAPSPLFLSYISAVLPDLGVEKVIQTTFADWCLKHMKKEGLKLLPGRRLEYRLTADSKELAESIRISRKKGSLDMMHRVDSFLASYSEKMLPENGLILSQVCLYSPEELRKIFLEELRYFPLDKRIDELKKYVRKRLSGLCEKMKVQLRSQVETRLNLLLSKYPDGPERRMAAGKLLDARDQRLAAIDQLARDYLDHFRSLFPDLHLQAIYRTFLESCGDEDLSAATLPLLEQGKIRGEDLAILCHLASGIQGLKNDGLQHIVIDECQDFSPYQLALLKKIYPASTITAVGDLAQGIHDDEGTRTWEEWTGPVFHQNVAFRQLVISYRNTVEIMEAAAAVSRTFPVAGLPDTQPVLRHGEPVLRSLWAGLKDRNSRITEQVLAWQKEGFHSIALIEKTPDEAVSLYKELKVSLPVRLLTEKDTEYTGGILILPSTLVKGMEFDCVLICNASAEAFPADPFLTRLLYVMMTRPLHRLHIMARNAFSPMLEQNT